MIDVSVRPERFSGHESFICRYGWLPKIYRAVMANPAILRDDAYATTTLGIGRNMVKSVQFWAEATGVIAGDGQGKHKAGVIGDLLLSEHGWDPHLESLESLWLLHWQLSAGAGLAAWNTVFGESRLIRFDRQKLVAALADRGVGLPRSLAQSTLEQHASIFLQSYYQEDRSHDDTSWCPLQGLNLIRSTKTDDGRIVYVSDVVAPAGLTPRVFAVALVDYLSRRGQSTTDLGSLLKGNYSPGLIFRLDEYQLRQHIDKTIADPLKGALRFVDTADTQGVVLDPSKLAPQFQMWLHEEVPAYV
ncbi:MAG: DUF4007 family protein [Acidihalobacter sp.]|uniref:DUF4007 family protein n=1 Tax=Acidihalobacter sp. TaxID=1872108 RepID=UPI00307FB4AD